MEILNTTTTTAEEDSIETSLALLLSIGLLYVILLLSYLLQRRKIRIIHETVVSILLGMTIGLFLFLTGNKNISKIVAFDYRYFFNLLLPPIILNSGYDLHRQNFFKNFGTILVFALGGTFISTLVIGSLLYFLVSLGLYSLQMSYLDCIIIGSILSSTDPVTILSLFHQLKVDPKLYAIIFGESLLNDSVAIVLFSTLGKLRGQELGFLTISKGFISFFAVFSGSVMIGILAGLLVAILLKYTRLDLYPSLETCLVILQAYSSYMLSNALQFSGIVSLLFCGITLKHYAYDNMSPDSRHTTKHMFRVLSQMSENFIFIYLGLSLFTKTGLVFLPWLIFFIIIIILIARYFSVIPLAWLINLLHSWRNPDEPDVQIPRNHQLMIWWAGLRGAIAFALSYDIQGVERDALQTTILVVCVVSIVLLGGSTPFALEYLDIKTGQGLPEEEGYNGIAASATDIISLDGDGEGDDSMIRRSFESDVLPTSQPRHWFLSFDSNYLKPVFSRAPVPQQLTPISYFLNRGTSRRMSGESNSPQRGESSRFLDEIHLQGGESIRSSISSPGHNHNNNK